MSDERPEGWIEPVHEVLLRPQAFFGAAPRHVILAVYAVTALVVCLGAMSKTWILSIAAIIVTAIIQIAAASLTYLEPNWFELLSEWLRSPQSRVDP